MPKRSIDTGYRPMIVEDLLAADVYAAAAVPDLDTIAEEDDETS